MSKVGKNLIDIPKDTKVDFKDNVLTCTGPQGELKHEVPRYLKVTIEDDKIAVTLDKPEERRDKMKFWGLHRSLIANNIEGVSKGFTKELEIQGVGYRVGMKGEDLELIVGYSHPVIYKVPEGVKLTVKDEFITVTGIDKQKVGQAAAQIKSIKKPDAYKGKGLRYKGEEIKLKQGKKAVGETE